MTNHVGQTHSFFFSLFYRHLGRARGTWTRRRKRRGALCLSLDSSILCRFGLPHKHYQENHWHRWGFASGPFRLRELLFRHNYLARWTGGCHRNRRTRDRRRRILRTAIRPLAGHCFLCFGAIYFLRLLDDKTHQEPPSCRIDRNTEWIRQRRLWSWQKGTNWSSHCLTLWTRWLPSSSDDSRKETKCHGIHVFISKKMILLFFKMFVP